MQPASEPPAIVRPPRPGRPGALLRVLGTAFGLAITVGAAIGGGIARTPGEVAAALPSAALFMAVWVFGAINTLLGANIFAELATMMPRAGGPYVFARRAFGDGVGFFIGYTDWITLCLGGVALLLIVGEYAGGLLPQLQGHAAVVGFATLGGLAALQWIGVRTGGRIQELTTLLKALALLGLVVAAFVLPHPAVAAPPLALPHGLPLLVAFGVAMQGVIFSYENYFAVVYCSEEMRDPAREIPRSLFRGVWVIIAIYLVVNAAYLAVLPVATMARDPFVGGTLARALFGARGDFVIRLVIVVSVLGTLNAILIEIPRLLLAMSRDGLFLERAAQVNRGGTPEVALVLTLLVIAGFLLTGSFTVVLGLTAILIVVRYVFCFAALFVLRRREPEAPRPYRARGYPAVPALALAVALALLVTVAAGEPANTLVVLAVLAASWPLSRAVRRASS